MSFVREAALSLLERREACEEDMLLSSAKEASLDSCIICDQLDALDTTNIHTSASVVSVAEPV